MGVVLLLLSIFNTKIRANYYNSYKQIFKLLKLSGNIKNSNKTVLMFHAASVGEYEQIKPILRGLNRSEFFIVQTFTSPSIYNIESVDKEDLYDIKCYHPFDIFWLSYSFFKIIHPEKYIITRHDLWPGHILMANYFQIPIYYINANIHKNSLWYKKSLSFFVRYFFKKINYFVVPSNDIEENLKLILPYHHYPKIKVIQDTRFNQISYIKDKNQFVSQAKDPNNKWITFGSIDELDERIIFKVLPALIKEGYYIFLVPHEVDIKNISRLEKELVKASLPYNKYSERDIAKDEYWDSKEKIILIDALGILSELYSFGVYAYVGGGFKRGVHSVLEPAAYGCLISCGPNIEMLDEAKLLKQEGHLQIIHNDDDFFSFINKSKRLPNFMNNISPIATDMIDNLVSDSSDNYNISLNQ